MKRLNDTIYNTTMIKQKLDHDSIKNLEEEVQELNKVLTSAHDELQVHGNNVTELVFDTNAIGEWQTLTDNKITGLRNELENTADNIMDKMFEKDDSIGKKMKEYDSKILSFQNDYNKLQADITMMDRAAKDTKRITDDKVRYYYINKRTKLYLIYLWKKLQYNVKNIQIFILDLGQQTEAQRSILYNFVILVLSLDKEQCKKLRCYFNKPTFFPSGNLKTDI